MPFFLVKHVEKNNMLIRWLFEQCLLFSTNKCVGFFLPPAFLTPPYLARTQKKQPRIVGYQETSIHPPCRHSRASPRLWRNGMGPTLRYPNTDQYQGRILWKTLVNLYVLSCIYTWVMLLVPTVVGFDHPERQVPALMESDWSMVLGLIKRVLNNAEVNEMTGKGIHRQRYQQSIFIPPGCLVTRNTSPVTFLSLNFSHFLIVCLANTPSCHFSSLQKYRSIMVALRFD